MHSTFALLPAVPRRRRPRRRQHVGHHPRRDRRDHADRRPRSSCTCRPSSTTAAGSSSPAGSTGRTTERWAGDDARRVELALGRRRVAHARRALPRQPPALDRRARPPAAGAHVARRARPADPLRLRRTAVAAVGVPERVRHRAGQRRDAERGPAVHARGDHPARRQGRRCHAGRAAHRRRVARGRRAARTPSGCASRRRPRTRVNATHDAGGRVVAVGTTVVRALETAVDDDGTVHAVRRLDRPRRSRPSAACARSTACSPAGTSPRRRTC